ncbi:MAG: type II secretion system F family protein [Planctomycetes bacterium]|nr:type II secretion system F family protein [Planctomycetota bacterium]
MATFQYKARNAGGAAVSGVLTVPNRQEALAQLRRMNLTPLTVAPSRAGMLAGLFSGPPRPNVGAEDLTIFTRQLSTMISAGISLVESLEILSEQASDKGFRHVLKTIVEEIRGGSDMSTAFEKHAKIFDKIYVSMLRAGEASGKLDAILVRLAEYKESQEELKREVKSAMTYPTISLVMVMGIALFLIIVIVPKFKDLFENTFKADLPRPTKIVMAISDALREHTLVVLSVTAAVLAALFAYVSRTRQGLRQWHWLKLHIPVFGPLFQKIAVGRFTRTFGTLLQSGVPIVGALDIVRETVGNVLIEEDVDRAREAVRQGEPLAVPLARSKVFPLMVTRMIAVGEKTGALEQLLDKISDFYSQQVRATVKMLTSLIEPMMIGAMGLIVGGIVVAIFLPIFQAPALIGK